MKSRALARTLSSGRTRSRFGDGRPLIHTLSKAAGATRPPGRPTAPPLINEGARLRPRDSSLRSSAFGFLAAITIGSISLVAAGCGARSPQLDTAARIRVQQLQMCDCLSHDQFPTVRGYISGDWYGEVLAGQTGAPLTMEQALRMWYASLEHRSILRDYGANPFGFAASASPTATGWYYAVMIVARE